MNFLSNLKILREQKNLSQADLSRFSGLTPAAISQIESGERVPSLYSLIKICSALEVKIDDLVNEKMKFRKIKFEAYLIEKDGQDSIFAVDYHLGKLCSSFFRENHLGEGKMSKWEVIMREIPYEN